MMSVTETTGKQKRPWYLTWLAVLVFLVAVINLLRFLGAIRQWQLLNLLPLSIDPLYMALSGAVWALVGLPMAAGLWLGWRWVWIGLQAAGLIFAIYYWIDRLWLAQASTLIDRWPFVLLLTISLLIYLFSSLWAPGARTFFHQ